MIKYKEKFEYIIKKIINKQLNNYNLNNFNLNYILYNNYLNAYALKKNDILISNKIYYLFSIFFDILHNVFLENGKIVFINSNLYFELFFYENIKNTNQYWILGRYPTSYFSNKFYRGLYNMTKLKKNIFINLPITLNKYNKLVFILFYTQIIDNLYFLNEIKKFINFLTIDFINIKFIEKNLFLNYSYLNYEDNNMYLDSTSIEFFFSFINIFIFKLIFKKYNLNYLSFYKKIIYKKKLNNLTKIFWKKIKKKKIKLKNLMNVKLKIFYILLKKKKIKKLNILLKKIKKKKINKQNLILYKNIIMSLYLKKKN